MSLEDSIRGSPRLLETSVLFLVNVNEWIRISLRDRLAMPSPIYQYYINYCGDIWDGYVIAFFLDMAFEYVSDALAESSKEEGVIYGITNYIRNNYVARNIASTLMSSSIVILAETYSILNSGDSPDIPPGIIGALLKAGIGIWENQRQDKLQSIGDYTQDIPRVLE